MPKPLRLLIPLLLIAAIAAIWWWRGEEQIAANGILKLYGNVEMREVQLAINGNDRIAGMQVEEGERVKRGQLLAELDKSRLQALLDGAAARTEAQQAVVDRMMSGTRPEDIRKARAELAGAEAQAVDAERTYHRLQKLSRQELASKEQRDNAATAAKAARERVKAATELLSLAIQGPRKEDITAARAQLKANKAQQALAQHELDDASLYAPADGIIRNRILEPGDMASPQRPVYTLAITDPLWVRAYLSETDLGRVHPGMQAEVMSDSFSGKSYRGWVGYISPTAEFTPQSVQTEDMRTQLVYQVRVHVCNPQNELRLGMPVSVRISLSQPDKPMTEGDPCAQGQQ